MMELQYFAISNDELQHKPDGEIIKATVISFGTKRAHRDIGISKDDLRYLISRSCVSILFIKDHKPMSRNRLLCQLRTFSSKLR